MGIFFVKLPLSPPSLALELDVELRTEPSDSLALRSRRWLTVSASRGFLKGTLNMALKGILDVSNLVPFQKSDRWLIR
jgi:hypothetical protein